MDTLAERSKAVAQGAIPKGRGFEPHRCHFLGEALEHRKLQRAAGAQNAATCFGPIPFAFAVESRTQQAGMARPAQSAERKALHLVVVGSSPTVGVLGMSWKCSW